MINNEYCIHDSRWARVPWNECIECKAARAALAQIIASQTNGFIEAIPDSDDFDLAESFLKQIENRYSSSERR